MSRKRHLVVFFTVTVFSIGFQWLISGVAVSYKELGPYYYLGGPALGIPSPQQILEWLLVNVPVWSVCGWVLNALYSNVQIVFFRYKNIRCWWLRQLAKVYAVFGWYYLLMFLILRWRMRACWDEGMYALILILFLHGALMVSVMIGIYLLSRNLLSAYTVLLLTEALAVIPVAREWITPQFWLPVWGMYGFSREQYGNGGFEMVYAATGMFIIGCILIVIPIVWKQLLIRSLSHEKNRIDGCE